MRSYGSTSTRSAERDKEVVDPEDLADPAERPNPEDLADPAERPDPEGLADPAERPDPEDAAASAGLADPGDPGGAAASADPVGLAALAQVAPRPMKSCVTTSATVTTRSSSASATRPTILVSKGRT